MRKFLLVFCLTVAAMACADNGLAMIKLTAGEIDPDIGLPPLPGDLVYPATADVTVYLAHIDGRVTPSVRRAIEAAGAMILSYIPDNAFIIRADAATLKSVSCVAGVGWTARFEPFFKINPRLLALDGDEGQVRLCVLLWSDRNGQTVADRAAALGAVQFAFAANPAHVKLGIAVSRKGLRSALAALAAADDVYWIEEYPEYHLCNNDTAWVCQSGLYDGHATPLYDRGITGTGEIVAVMDTGADADMCFFYDAAQGLPNSTPNEAQRKIIAYLGPTSYTGNWDAHGHGTHTAGTVAGDNFATPGSRDSGDGIAVGAKLVIQDYGDASDVHPPSDQYAAHEETFAAGARVHSNSWGWPGNPGVYHGDCQEVDHFMWDSQDFLSVYAAGNEGSSSDRIRPPGSAKNVLTVGAADPGAGAENNAYFSSHGPVDDGRRKPDITICGGFSIYSAASDRNINTFNCNTTGMAGTSMATPGAAGCAALVRQYYADGYYPNGSADPQSALTPSGALIKATLINSGDNMTGSYTADAGSGHGDIPTNGQGWGRIHLDNVLYFDGDERRLFIDDHRAGLVTGETVSYDIGNLGGTPLEITLVWTDYPGNPAASVQLVNDLDLTVTADGVEYKGSVYAGGESAPGGNYDRLNPIECVQLPAASSGLVTVTVSAFNAPQGPQNFALVVSGNLSFSDGSVALDRGKYGCADTVTVFLTDGDLMGAGVQTITLESESHPQQSYELFEAPTDSGTFSGQFTTTAGEPGPGEIRVQADDTLTVRYIDVDDGHGGINVEKTASAVIDCTGPVISGVEFDDISRFSAVVRWTTNEPASSVVEYAVTPGVWFTSAAPELVLEHALTVAGLEPCTFYYVRLRSVDECANETLDENGGQFFGFQTDEAAEPLNAPFDFSPGWFVTSAWTFGQPMGACGDPTSGHTGPYAYGYDYASCYPNNMGGYTLTSHPVNCSDGDHVRVSFWRWLTVEGNAADHAVFEVSTDYTTWTTVWENGASAIQDAAWTQMDFDISHVADNQSAVYLQWRMGPSNGSVTYGGWNIDDVIVYYERPCSLPTPTPWPTPTPSPTVTLTPTITPTWTGTPTPTTSPTPTNSPTNAPTNSPTPTTSPTTSPTNSPAPTHSPTPTTTHSPGGSPTATPPPATATATATPTPSPQASAEPTATPDTNVTPSPTPCVGVWIALDLNGDWFMPGDEFHLVLQTVNGAMAVDAHQYVILDVYGQYWFYPSWSQTVDYEQVALAPEHDGAETILRFIWPQTADSASGIMFWAALVDTSDSALVSNLEQRQFGFGQL